jgi:hypothetical protein
MRLLRAKDKSYKAPGDHVRRFIALKNPEGFFNVKEEALRRPEILRNFRAAC